MRRRSRAIMFFAVMLLAATILGGPGGDSGECPPSFITPCNGIKINIGDSYFACSKTLYTYQNGHTVVICCTYEVQNVLCIISIPPLPLIQDPGKDRTTKTPQTPMTCISASEYQYCGPVVLE